MATWIAFFSQTGSEIVELSNQLQRVPDLIVHNRSTKISPHVYDLGTVLMSGTHSLLMDYFSNSNVYGEKETIITLHGYLRLLPPSVVNKYEIYNGHPGLFDRYPSLKGMDPQEKTWENRLDYPIVGSVVHRVNELVDDGEVVSKVEIENQFYTKNGLYSGLRKTSLEAWVNFLKVKLNETGD